MAVPKMGVEAYMEMAEFVVAVKQYNTAMDGMEKNTVDSAKKIDKATASTSRGVEKTGKSALTAKERFAVYATGISSAIHVMDRIIGVTSRLVSGMVDLTKEAASIQAVRSAFEGLGGDIEKMRKATGGLVEDVALMKSYNTAAQLVGKTFAEQLPDAMGYLAKVSAATGETMDFMISSLVKGVGRLSPMILDNLGIQVALSEATARGTQMFGLQADQLSKNQQQTAMMAVVMEKLRVNTAAMPDVIGTATGDFMSFEAAMANARQELGEALLPVIQELFPHIMKITKELSKAFTSPEFKRGIVSATKLMSDVLGSLLEIEPGAIKAGLAFVGLGAALAEAIIITQGFTLGFEALTLAIATNPVGLAITALVLAGVGLVKITDKMIKQQQELAAQLEKTSDAMMVTSETYSQYTKRVTDNYVAQTNLMHQVDDTGRAEILLAAGVLKTRTAFELANEQARLAAYGLTEVEKAAKPLTGAVVDGSDALSGYKLQLGDVAEATVRVADESWQIKALFEQQLFGGAIEGTEAYKEHLVALGETWDEVFDPADIAKSFGKIMDVVAKGTAKLEEIRAKHESKMFDLAWNHDLNMLKAEQQYNADRLGLMNAGKIDEAAALDIKYNQQRQMSEREYNIQIQLQQRALLKQIADQKWAYYNQLVAQHDNEIKGLIQKVKAYAETEGADKTHADNIISLLVAAGSDQLRAEQKKFNALLDMQAAAQAGSRAGMASAVADYTAGINSMTRAAESAAQQAEGAWKAFTIDLPAVSTTLFDASIPSATAAITKGAKTTETAVERLTTVVEQVDRGIAAAMDAIDKLLYFDVPVQAEEGLRRFNAFVNEILIGLYGAAEGAYKHGKTIKKMAEAVQLYFEGYAMLINAISGAAAGPEGVADVAANLKPWAEQIQAFIGIMVETMDELVTAVSPADMEEAAATLEIIQPLFSIIGTDLTGITVADLPDVSVWAGQVSEVITAIIEMLDNLGKEKGTIMRGAAGFSSLTKTLLGVVVPAIDALVALASYEGLDDITSIMDDFQRDIGAVVFALLETADCFEVEGLKAAGDFASAAMGVLAIIKPTIDALASLGTYEPLQYLRGRIASMAFDLKLVLEGLEGIGDSWDPDALEAGGTFAKAAKEVVAIIKPAVDALASLGEYAPMQYVRGRIALVRTDLEFVLEELEKISFEFRQESEDLSEFSKAVSAILGIIKPAIDALGAIADYAEAANLDTQMEKFSVQLGTIITGMGEIAVMYETDGVEETAKFAKAVGDITGSIGSSVSALAALGGYEDADITQAMLLFKADLIEFLNGLEDTTLTLDTEGKVKADQFRAIAQAIGEAIDKGLDLLTGETAPDAGPLKEFADSVKEHLGDAVGTAWEDLLSIKDAFAAVDDPIVNSANRMATAINSFSGAVQGMPSELPEWLQPGSPPPLANALFDVAAAMRQIQMANAPQPMPAQPMPAGMFGGGGAVTNNVQLDFGGVNINNGMDMTNFEGRIRQTVAEAIA